MDTFGWCMVGLIVVVFILAGWWSWKFPSPYPHGIYIPPVEKNNCCKHCPKE